MSVIVVDGVSYPNLHVSSLKRSFAVLDGSNAGRVMNGSMVRDIIGTYYNYSVEISSDLSDPAEYDSFYEVMSAPADYHTLTLPYAQTTYTFRAYVSGGEDSLDFIYDNQNRWNGLSLSFVAMAPQRRPS